MVKNLKRFRKLIEREQGKLEAQTYPFTSSTPGRKHASWERHSTEWKRTQMRQRFQTDINSFIAGSFRVILFSELRCVDNFWETFLLFYDN